MMQGPANYWRDIPGTGGTYQISRIGEIRHLWPSGHISAVKPYLKIGKAGSDHGDRLHVHLRINGKQRTWTLFSLLTAAWVGAPPPGMTWYHKNGNQFDNSIENIGLIDRQELGRITGARSRRRAVEMVDPDGNVIELYNSAREAADANHMDLRCVTNRCENRIKRPYALNGYTFRWEEKTTGRYRKNVRRKA